MSLNISLDNTSDIKNELDIDLNELVLELDFLDLSESDVWDSESFEPNSQPEHYQMITYFIFLLYGACFVEIEWYLVI